MVIVCKQLIQCFLIVQSDKFWTTHYLFTICLLYLCVLEENTKIFSKIYCWRKIRKQLQFYKLASCPTSKISTISQLCHCVSISTDHINSTLLYEVHFGTKATFTQDQVSRLEHLELQFGHHSWHEQRICPLEEGDHVDQLSTVVVQDLLETQHR